MTIGTFTLLGLGLCIAAAPASAVDCDVLLPVGGGFSGIVHAVAEYNGELIALGNFSQADGLDAQRIARYDGATWHQLADGANAVLDYFGLTLFEGKLIITGFVSPLDEQGQTIPVTNVLMWDGEAWGSLGEQQCNGTTVSAIHNGDLVVGLYDFGAANCEHHIDGSANPIRGVVRWNGEHWLQVGDTSDFATVTALIEFEGDLIAGDEAGAVRRWDGRNWNLIGQMHFGTVSPVRAFAVFDGQLVAAGRFTEADGATVNHIARLENGVWTDMAGGMDDQVRALTVYQDQLYATGEFNVAGGVSAGRIARWTGDAWESFGSLQSPGGRALTQYQDMLIGGGVFQEVSSPQAGTILARRIAAYLPCADEITGACCIGGGCLELTAEACLSGGGTYLGDNTICDVNDCPAPCPGDISGPKGEPDGIVDVLDLIELINNWGPCP